MIAQTPEQQADHTREMEALRLAFKEVCFRDLHKRIFELDQKSNPHAWAGFLVGVKHAKGST